MTTPVNFMNFHQACPWSLSDLPRTSVENDFLAGISRNFVSYGLGQVYPLILVVPFEDKEIERWPARYTQTTGSAAG